MKFKYLALVILPLTFAACQSNGIPTSNKASMKIQQINPVKTLSSYQWTQATADAGVPKPIVLNFGQDGRLSISTSCNTLVTQWKVENSQIVTSNMISTMMACPDNYMKQEDNAANWFDGRKVPFVLDTNDQENPKLTLTAKNGEKVVLNGQMTPEYKYSSAGEIIFLEVSPETKQCTGVAKQTCLQVREIKYAKNGVKTQVDKNWTLFYDKIEGFQHTPDEHQIIRVKRFELKNPAADQSKYAYIYDMSVERGRVK